MTELHKKAFKLFLAHPVMLAASVFQDSSYVCFIWGSYSWESVLGGNCTFPLRLWCCPISSEDSSAGNPCWGNLQSLSRLIQPALTLPFPALEYWFLEDKDLFYQRFLFLSTESHGTLDSLISRTLKLRLPGCDVLETKRQNFPLRSTVHLVRLPCKWSRYLAICRLMEWTFHSFSHLMP